MNYLKKGLGQLSVENFIDPLMTNGISGFKGFDSAEKIANKYIAIFQVDEKKAVNRIIKEHCLKTSISNAGSTFATAFLAPIAITANLASTMLLQVRMVSAIAMLYGHNTDDAGVKDKILACLTLDKFDVDASLVVKKKVSSDLLVATSEAIAQQVLLKTTKKSMVHQSQYIPLFGTIIGSAYDFYTTNTVGYFALKQFAKN